MSNLWEGMWKIGMTIFPEAIAFCPESMLAQKKKFFAPHFQLCIVQAPVKNASASPPDLDWPRLDMKHISTVPNNWTRPRNFQLAGKPYVFPNSSQPSWHASRVKRRRFLDRRIWWRQKNTASDDKRGKQMPPANIRANWP